MEVRGKKESKDFQNTDIKYELSALLDADSFFYGLFDYGSKLAFSNNIDSIDGLAQESWRGQTKLRKTKIGLLNSLIVMIPETEFRAADIAPIVTTTCNLSDTSQYIIRSDRIEKHGLRVCYAVPKELVKTMTNTLDGPILNHYVSTFLDSITDTSVNALYIDLSSDLLIIAACRDGKLFFANTYLIKESLDGLYWISSVHKSVFEDDRATPIFYSGKNIEVSTLLITLGSYYSQLKKMTHSISFDGDPIKGDVYYYPLYCISQM